MSEPVRWNAPDLMAPRVVQTPPEERFGLDIETIVDPALEMPAPEPLPEPPTAEEIEAIKAAAHAEGLEQGHKEGYAKGEGEVRRLAAQIEGILDNFSRPLSRLEDEVVAALGDLAVRVAGQLVGRAYETDPSLLADLAREAVATVGGANREVEIRLHPDDIHTLQPLLELGAGQALVPDLTLSRGDLRVHAESVRVDGTLDARLRGALATVMRRAGAPT